MVDFGKTRCSAFKISAERMMTLHGVKENVHYPVSAGLLFYGSV